MAIGGILTTVPTESLVNQLYLIKGYSAADLVVGAILAAGVSMSVSASWPWVWVVALIAGAVVIINLGKRLVASTAPRVVPTGDHAVFLRSFDEDRSRLKASPLLRNPAFLIRPARILRLEQVIAGTLNPLAPLVAISDPRRKLPSLGAAQLSVGDDWQKQVIGWTSNARLVVLIATPEQVNEGFAWELSHVREIVNHVPIILVAAPYPLQERRGRWRRFLDHTGPWTSSLRLAPDTLLVAAHHPRRGWHCWGAGDDSAFSYAVALNHASEYVTAPVNRPR